jgi:hypothetical protein
VNSIVLTIIAHVINPLIREVSSTFVIDTIMNTETSYQSLVTQVFVTSSGLSQASIQRIPAITYVPVFESDTRRVI